MLYFVKFTYDKYIFGLYFVIDDSSFVNSTCNIPSIILLLTSQKEKRNVIFTIFSQQILNGKVL